MPNVGNPATWAAHGEPNIPSATAAAIAANA